MINMLNKELFRQFLTERLTAVGVEIFSAYEQTIADYQIETDRSSEENARLQRLVDIFTHPDIKLHRADVQKPTLPESPQEEQELWTSQGEEQLQGLESDTIHFTVTSPTAETYCVQEDSTRLSLLSQTPIVDNREDSLPTNTTDQMQAESDEEDDGVPEPASNSKSPSVVCPDGPTAQSLEEERVGLLPELKPSKSNGTQTEKMQSFLTQVDSSKLTKRKKSFLLLNKYPKICCTYRCQECGKRFRRRSRLDVHLKTHKEEEPFLCRQQSQAALSESQVGNEFLPAQRDKMELNAATPSSESQVGNKFLPAQRDKMELNTATPSSESQVGNKFLPAQRDKMELNAATPSSESQVGNKFLPAQRDKMELNTATPSSESQVGNKFLPAQRDKMELNTATPSSESQVGNKFLPAQRDKMELNAATPSSESQVGNEFLPAQRHKMELNAATPSSESQVGNEFLPAQRDKMELNTATPLSPPTMHNDCPREDLRKADPLPISQIHPDINIPPLTSECKQILTRRSHGRPDRYACLLFRAVVSQDRYLEWATNTNWNGSRGKFALPKNLKQFIMNSVYQVFPSLNDGQRKPIKDRINEYLRSPRRTLRGLGAKQH